MLRIVPLASLSSLAVSNGMKPVRLPMALSSVIRPTSWTLPLVERLFFLLYSIHDSNTRTLVASADPKGRSFPLAMGMTSTRDGRSEEHMSELQSHSFISYAV